MGSTTVKLLLAVVLVVAVCQLHLSSAAGYSRRAAADQQAIKDKVNAVNKTHHKEADKPKRYMPMMGMNSMHMMNMRAAPEEDEDQDDETYDTHEQRAAEATKEPPSWKPNTDPQHFQFKVTDNIHGADQYRQESVKDNVVEGSWAVPVDDSGKMFRKTEYKADKTGFHIISEKLVSRDELTGGQKTNPDEANVEIDQLGGNTAYTVKASDMKKNQEKQQQQQQKQRQRRSPYNQNNQMNMMGMQRMRRSPYNQMNTMGMMNHMM